MNVSIKNEYKNPKELMSLKDFILPKPMIFVSVLYTIIGTFLRWVLDFIQKHVIVVMIQCKKLSVLMSLQLFMLMEMITELIFSVWVKMNP